MHSSMFVLMPGISLLLLQGVITLITEMYFFFHGFLEKITRVRAESDRSKRVCFAPFWLNNRLFFEGSD